MVSLEERWGSLVGELGVKEDCCRRWWRVVCERYSEPQRFYHTLDHIRSLFVLFDEVNERGMLSRPDLVALAIFFHE